MKISEQYCVPSFNFLPQEHKSGANAPSALGHAEEVEGQSVAGQSSGKSYKRCHEYPVANDQEIQIRNARSPGKFRLFKLKPTKTGPKVPHSSARQSPSLSAQPELARGLKGAHGDISTANTIKSLHQDNAFPSVSSQLAHSARDAFTGAVFSTLITLPFSVAEHIGSKAIADRIDAQTKMPGAGTKKADGTTSTVDPSATEQQKMEARLEDAEIKTEVMVNSILSINEGPDAMAVGKNPNASTDTAGRLVGLEQRMDAVEAQMQAIAQRCGLVYMPYVAPGSPDAPTDESRMGVIEQRYLHMNKMLKKLIAAKSIDAEV